MENVFLGIFIFGALFTLLSAAFGAVAGVGHGHIGHVHHGHDAGGWRSLPFLNGSAVMAFLTWFGAAGYLLTKVSDWALPGVVVGALIGGAIGGYLVARYLGLVLRGERVMDPDDYRMQGTVGHITISVPANGTGEMVFSKAGTRRSEAARSLGGTPIPRGTEVVIAQYTKGIATVQPWAEFMAAHEGVATTERTAESREVSKEHQ